MRNAIARATVALGALSVAACGGQSGSIPVSGLKGPTSATQAVVSRTVSPLAGGLPAQARETVLYSFAGGTDGDGPATVLTDINGVLYGTTLGGGVNRYGSVYQITTSGAESVLYSFRGGRDGGSPAASLTAVNGVLYGTTSRGGANNDGTVFKLTTAGAESVLHSFGKGSDFGGPSAALTNVDGVLYGTTCCTIFKITTSGSESVLYSFLGTDATPKGNLTDVDGVLYGAAIGSGNTDGNIFKITTSGAESVLYSFKGGSDGSQPLGGLTYVNGTLYGTTQFGGTHSCSRSSCGTVFKITTSGTEKVIHSFGGGNDGKAPNGNLANVNGVLYGTTYEGGGGDVDYGTVFKITTSGAKSAVYSFQGGSDGAAPFAGLTYVNGVLLGTTLGGGSNSFGTIFSLSI